MGTALREATAPSITRSVGGGRPAASSRARLLALAPSLPLAAVVFAAGVWRSPSGGLTVSLFDDAMISMSYGRTLAKSGELVWFPGGPRTEGITNVGWTLVMATLHWLSLPANLITVLLVVVSLLAVWATALLAGRLATAIAGTADARAEVLAIAATASSFPLLWWSLRGMEVGVVTLLTVLILAKVLAVAARPVPRRADLLTLGLAVAAGVAVRTDVVIVAGVAVLWLLADPAVKNRHRAALAVAGPAALAVVTGLVARLVYYGEPFPNTYYLKLTGVPLMARLERGGWAGLVTGLAYFVGPAVVALVAGRHRLRSPAGGAARLVVLVAAAWAAYSTYVGADAWEWFLLPNRYLVPSLVLLLVVAIATLVPVGDPARGARATWSARARAFSLVAIGAGPTVAFLTLTARPRPDLAIAVGLDRVAWLAPSIALFVAGCLGARHLLRGADTPQATDRRFLVLAVGLSMATTVVAVPAYLVDHPDDSATHAYFGVQVQEITAPDAVVAFAAAGGTQYYSGRPAVDLLGKSDAHIAHQPPPEPGITWPGHDKHDGRHSVGDLRPDLVAHVSAGLTPGDLVAWGYRPYAPIGAPFNESAPRCGDLRVVWARTGSPRVLWDRLQPVDPASCG